MEPFEFFGPTPILYCLNSANDFDFGFLLIHNRSNDSNYNSDSVAGENQPLNFTLLFSFVYSVFVLLCLINFVVFFFVCFFLVLFTKGKRIRRRSVSYSTIRYSISSQCPETVSSNFNRI